MTPEGSITTWLNEELAFVPVDYHPSAPKDEMVRAISAAACSTSRSRRWDDCSGRRASRVEPGLGLPEKLKHVQALMKSGDPRAAKIYESIGVFSGMPWRIGPGSARSATCWCLAGS